MVGAIAPRCNAAAVDVAAAAAASLHGQRDRCAGKANEVAGQAILDMELPEQTPRTYGGIDTTT